MPEPSWVFQVEDSFAVSGRATAVLGTLRGTIPTSPTVASLHVGEAVRRLPEVWVEFARVRGEDRIALLLRQVDKAEVPVGSTLMAQDALDQPSSRLMAAIVGGDLETVASLAAVDPHLSGASSCRGR